MASTAIAREPAKWPATLVLIPLILAVLLAAWIESNHRPKSNAAEPALQLLLIDSAQTLQTVYVGIGYDWPPEGPIPAIELQRLPDDMATLPPDAKKQLFFQSILPIVLAENERIAQQRAFVKAQFASGLPRAGSADAKKLKQLAAQYGVKKTLDDDAARKRLLRRIDTVPAALVLAQAAKESGWGTSRFAREGNNLFGVWTWDAEAGLAPREAGDDADHYVRAFPDLRASVRGYLYNINVGHAYLKLRKLRAAERAAGARLEAVQLAGALENYSARGMRYVRSIQRMIRNNRLTALRDLNLRLAPMHLMARD
ncbi:MAG TPA: glucosaminidase domain-containing protein [Gammaproteobacteria bacterium]|nr:glucosaminidase domain-containing protein [Gammaproteobacteria bacterium]